MLDRRLTITLFCVLTICWVWLDAHGLSAQNQRQDQDEKQFVISLQEIDCQSCGTEVAAMLGRQVGVRKASFDQLKAELTVRLKDQSASPSEMLELVHRAGHQAVLGAGKGNYLDPIEFEQTLDVDWISRAGEAAEISEHLVQGKVTVVDFYAVWCGPCREVDEEMRTILANDPKVALRKINVVDWDSPIARQELSHVEGLPYVEVFDSDGKRVARIAGLNLERLRRSIAKAKR